MFVDLTEVERERFLKNTIGCYIPGYTGHCPSLKFRYGKRYGADTKDILEELRDIPVLTGVKHCDISCHPFLPGVQREKDVDSNPVLLHTPNNRPYILGYTGFIPGKLFEYGSSFNRTAEKCLRNFNLNLSQLEKRRREERAKCFSTAPQIVCIRGKDHVKDALEHYSQSVTGSVPEVCPNLPPIAGYTGHIPGVKGNDSSVSQRFHLSALEGLAMLHENRYKRCHLLTADDLVRDAITYSHVH